MGISIDLAEARSVLEAAVEVARSNAQLPNEWTDRTIANDQCPSKTFTPVLGTALLAKATDPRIDALSLKQKPGKNAYSARVLADKVLVPGAIVYGYFLRTTGREPLNNQPFFRYLRIDEIDRIKGGAAAYLPKLIEACEEINMLGSEEARLALAAFLRVRIQAHEDRENIDLRASELSLLETIDKTVRFVTEKPEGGKRGQAFVAAAFDLGGHDVRSIRVNDPSRNMPGDVIVIQSAVPVLAVEVRQKPVDFEDTQHFAESLRGGGVPLGLVAMLSPKQKQLDADEVQAKAEQNYGVALDCAYGVRQMLLTSVTWSGQPLDESLRTFPERYLSRLREIEVADESIREWASQFE